VRKTLSNGGIVYYILVAGGARALRDRRLQATAITGVIGAVALFDVIKNNKARPVRRAASWYIGHGVREVSGSQKLARAHPWSRQELTRASRALERGKHS
jgi:hypothetical protein